jgi:hypothetical protein
LTKRLETGTLIITVFKNNFSQVVETLKSLESSSLKSRVVLKNGGKALSTEQIQALKSLRKFLEIDLIEKPDNGIYSAMNQAMVYSIQNKLLNEKEWVWFLNAGDKLETNAIDTLQKSIPRSLNSLIKFGEPTFGLKKTIRTAQKIDEHDFLSGKIRLNHQALLFHTKLFSLHTLYNEDYRIASDYLFIYHLLKSHTLEFIPSLRIAVEPGGISERRVGLVEIEKLRILLNLFLKSGKIFYLNIFRIRLTSLIKFKVKEVLNCLQKKSKKSL